MIHFTLSQNSPKIMENSPKTESLGFFPAFQVEIIIPHRKNNFPEKFRKSENSVGRGVGLGML
jgi:hypothetical protein